MAGRMVGPSVNRHTRRVLYPVCAVLLLLGTAIGWTLPILVRLASTGRLTVADLVFVVFAVSMTLFRSITFWLFLVVTGAVAYQRVR
jgi:ABC-type methionine transport system permease subunit